MREEASPSTIHSSVHTGNPLVGSDRLLASRGRARIGSIVQEVGWSERQFIAQFRHELGVSPKVFGRMLRFGRVVRTLRTGQATDQTTRLAIRATQSVC
jgi:AraC-like DNA-binding protein